MVTAEKQQLFNHSQQQYGMSSEDQTLQVVALVVGFIWGDDSVWELEQGGGCTTNIVTVLNATELLVFKWLLLCEVHLNF